MIYKFNGLKFTLLQLCQIISYKNHHKDLLKELKKKMEGKKVLLCGSGESLKNLASIKDNYDVICGTNGLLRIKNFYNEFTYFFIEDRKAFNNYVNENINENKLISVAGMPLYKSRQLNFLHKYGFPLFFKNPFFSRKGNCFFWGGSVAFFSLCVIIFCIPKKIGIIGIDMIDDKAYAFENYHQAGDSKTVPDFLISRHCLKHFIHNADKYFSGVEIKDHGYGRVFEKT